MVEARVTQCIEIANRQEQERASGPDIIMQAIHEIRAEAMRLPAAQQHPYVQEVGTRLLAEVTPAEPKKHKGLAGKHVLRSRRDHFLHSLGTLAVGIAKGKR